MRTFFLFFLSVLTAGALRAQSIEVAYEPPQNLGPVLLHILDPLDLEQVPSGFLYDRIGELPHPDSKENASRLPDFPEKLDEFRLFRKRFTHFRLWRNVNVKITDFREENALRAPLECRYLAGMN